MKIRKIVFLYAFLATFQTIQACKTSLESNVVMTIFDYNAISIAENSLFLNNIDLLVLADTLQTQPSIKNINCSGFLNSNNYFIKQDHAISKKTKIIKKQPIIVAVNQCNFKPSLETAFTIAGGFLKETAIVFSTSKNDCKCINLKLLNNLLLPSVFKSNITQLYLIDEKSIYNKRGLKIKIRPPPLV